MPAPAAANDEVKKDENGAGAKNEERRGTVFESLQAIGGFKEGRRAPGTPEKLCTGMVQAIRHVLLNNVHPNKNHRNVI